MSVQVSYPGVYIEEFTPGAPIEGVGTSTAAFIGVAIKGMMDEPTKLTSWDRFRALYGDEPVPGFFLWYAVRGFFENGGQVCYIVRASNGAYGKLTINTATGNKPLFVVVAREPGAVAINVATEGQHSFNGSVYRPNGPLKKKADTGKAEIVVDLATANTFRPGDLITIDVTGTTPAETLQIVRITPDPDPTTGNATLKLDKQLQNTYAVGKGVRLANIPLGTRTLRLDPGASIPADTLVEGTILTFQQGTTNKDTQIVSSVIPEVLPGTPSKVTYRVTLRKGLKFDLDMTAAANVQSEEFKITVAQGGGTTAYERLSVDLAHPRHYVNAINNDPDAVIRIKPVEPAPAIPLPGSLPAATPSTALADGKAEDLTKIGDGDFKDAVDALVSIDDVNLVSVPDGRSQDVQRHVIDHCQLTADRFAVLDCRPGLELFTAGETKGVDDQRVEVETVKGFAALYYPWLRVPPAGRGDLILVPPSGHVCGIIARSDLSRGVHKAPANEIVSGALAVERTMSDIDHGQLNLAGINVIRVFQRGGPPVLYGARTTANDRNWQYVNVRRLFLYLEESIQEGIRWAVFEPNNLQLWEKLKRSITEFLTRAWRDGALFGAKAENAFYVRIDEALNPFSEQALGRLHIEIGIRPTYPAEFIIVRIGIWPGGSEVSEG